MKQYYTLIALIILSFATGCTSKTRTLPSATGSIYECIVVSPSSGCQAIVDTMQADMPCLPQMEPYFNVSQVRNGDFDDFLKSARNILLVDIDAQRYVEPRVHFYRDRYSKPQAYCRLQAPDTLSLKEWWATNGAVVRNWFVREELARQGKFLRGSTNKKARNALMKHTGCDILVPEDYQLVKDSTDVLLCCNNKGPMLRYLVVYSYPYTDANTFTKEYLCSKRDSVMRGLISASVPGSYMGTEYKVFPPQMKNVAALKKDSLGGFYGTELRGLWRVYDGEAMGGPFVSHSRLDMVNGRIVTAEVFVFAAGQKKRNALRQAEAILYTLRLPEELKGTN
ncbi:MAG: DUF4837 family protein [Paludibacteraceae bacterium]|nr:DUF4837 family protein [Paludibacteraceae bacterium]